MVIENSVGLGFLTGYESKVRECTPRLEFENFLGLFSFEFETSF